MADDDVQLTDLAVIQRYSLAVRGATAARAELVAALQADLAWLQGGRRAAPTRAARIATPAEVEDAAPAEGVSKVPVKAAPAEEAAPIKPVSKAPAKKAPAKSASAKRKA